MKCILCESFSPNIICSSCQQNHLQPKLYRDRVGDVEVISFYEYDDIKELLYAKYHQFGSSILKILAKNSLGVAKEEFANLRGSYIIAIDDSVASGYSHTSILAHSFASPKLKQLHNVLRATNSVKYAGHNLDYKIANPREFVYNGKSKIDVILVDDVVTDGVTINEAKRVLVQNGVNLLFCLALSYSKGER